MSLGQIILNKRKKLNLTLDEVARRIGFSKPYLSTIETDKVENPPSDELLRKLEQALEFDPGLLLDIAHLEITPTDIRAKYNSMHTFISDAIKSGKNIRELLNKYPTIQDMFDKSNKKLIADKSIPVINKVAEGYPTDFDLDYLLFGANDYIRFPDIHDPHAFAIRVVGDSMETEYREGNIVIFSPLLR